MQTNFKCPCGMDLLDAKAVDMLRDKPKVDDIMICGMCRRPSKVTLLGMVYLTHEELNALTEDEKKDMSFAIRAVKRQLRNN